VTACRQLLCNATIAMNPYYVDHCDVINVFNPTLMYSVRVLCCKCILNKGLWVRPDYFGRADLAFIST
jgi:hypothetical protein